MEPQRPAKIFFVDQGLTMLPLAILKLFELKQSSHLGLLKWKTGIYRLEGAALHLGREKSEFVLGKYHFFVLQFWFRYSVLDLPMLSNGGVCGVHALQRHTQRDTKIMHAND